MSMLGFLCTLISYVNVNFLFGVCFTIWKLCLCNIEFFQHMNVAERQEIDHFVIACVNAALLDQG